MTLLDEEKKERQDAAKAEEAFAKWLEMPMTKLGLSLIPPGENREALAMLLRSAFDCGYAVGTGQILARLLDTMMKKDKQA